MLNSERWLVIMDYIDENYVKLFVCVIMRYCIRKISNKRDMDIWIL